LDDAPATIETQGGRIDSDILRERHALHSRADRTRSEEEGSDWRCRCCYEELLLDSFYRETLLRVVQRVEQVAHHQQHQMQEEDHEIAQQDSNE